MSSNQYNAELAQLERENEQLRQMTEQAERMVAELMQCSEMRRQFGHQHPMGVLVGSGGSDEVERA